MKFITVQDLPSKEYQNENGEIKKEFCFFNEITVPVNEQLGFRPMWAIPVTTFKETLISMLMVAPNYQRVFCVFDTNDYIRVDKIKYYENIKNDDSTIPIANNDLPNYLCEYCLDIEKLSSFPIIMGDVLRVNKVRDTATGLTEAAINMLHNEQIIPKEFQTIVSSYIKKIPTFDKNSVIQQLTLVNVSNKEYRADLIISWYLYKYTILPLLLWTICDDTKDQTLEEGRFNFDLISLETCMTNIMQLINLDQKFALWSYDDCSLEKFKELYESFNHLIIDSKLVLECLYDGKKIGRNDKCPCGSGKKFKKCCGKNF